MKRLKWVLEQGGMEVASGEGPRKFAHADALHYAMMYRQDGPVALYEIKGRKRILMLMATGGEAIGLW